MRELTPSLAGLMPPAIKGKLDFIHSMLKEWEWDLSIFCIHRPSFMAAYFNEPDYSAHHNGGPYSDGVSGMDAWLHVC